MFNLILIIIDYNFWYGQSECVITVTFYTFRDLFNPLRAKFFRENINIYLHFMSLLHIDMTHVLKILPQVRPGLTYST